MWLYIYILFHILFHYGLLQDIEYPFLCYTAEPCLFMPYNSLCLLIATSQFIPTPLPPPQQPQITTFS